MLILSRKKEETIVVTLPDGTEISIMIVDLRGDRVRLGIEAPKDFKILRKEIIGNEPTVT